MLVPQCFRGVHRHFAAGLPNVKEGLRFGDCMSFASEVSGLCECDCAEILDRYLFHRAAPANCECGHKVQFPTWKMRAGDESSTLLKLDAYLPIR